MAKFCKITKCQNPNQESMGQIQKVNRSDKSRIVPPGGREERWLSKKAKLQKSLQTTMQKIFKEIYI